MPPTYSAGNDMTGMHGLEIRWCDAYSLGFWKDQDLLERDSQSYTKYCTFVCTVYLFLDE